MPQDYNSTLNLPKTDFPMRAGLPKSEPETLKRWQETNVYEKLMEHNEGKPLYVLHDGPPYANGDIHLGHALNKVLKDIIVRYKNMTGFKAPYVPGWDTHGLPTELKARKKAGVGNSTSISEVELRKICRDFALGYIDDQRDQFKRLGGIGEWDNPYITLNHEYEAKQIQIFSEMACKGYIYRGLKPVYWCPDCETALAEAEIEYAEDPCHSIYVKFRVTDDLGKLSAMGADIKNTYFVIWTTTTWTLPANVAICVGPRFNYSLIKCDGEYYVMAEELYVSAMEAAGKENYEVIGTIKGSELEYMKTAHPFLDRTSLVIVGNHVTLESGTGCVHTAPGHGVDDYEVCRNYPELPMVVPVDAHGRLTEEAGMFAGLLTEEANKPIAEYLEKTNALFALQKIIHQYPHCWRCKKPVLFRATKQWFCSVDDFKDAIMHGESSGDIETRQNLYQATWNAILENPIIGVNREAGSHSLILDHWGYLGLVGLIPFLFFVIAQLRMMGHMIPQKARVCYYESVAITVVMMFVKNTDMWEMWLCLFTMLPVFAVYCTGPDDIKGPNRLQIKNTKISL